MPTRQPPLRFPRLRLAPPRASESVAFDGARTSRAERLSDELDIPPFIKWDEFREGFKPEQGEHITTVGSTGSGKTVLSTTLLDDRDYCCVLATKTNDPSLYPRLEKKGYVVTDSTELDAEREPKVIFRPGLEAPTREAQEKQREDFRTLLIEVFNEGGWALYGDEIRYLSDNLKLKAELELLWLQGRSLGITMIVSTQRPVSIPVVAFESASHLFLFRTTDQNNIDRAAEFESANKPLLRYLLPRLPRYEVLYIEARTGRMVRTKVRL